MKPDAIPTEERKEQIKASALFQSGEWFNRGEINAELGLDNSVLNTAMGQLVKKDALLETTFRRKPETNTRIVYYRRRLSRVNWLCDKWKRTLSNEQITGVPEYAR